MNIETARFNMIEQQIRTWEVLDPNVLEACGRLPRESFVPEAYRNLAFSDTTIDIGHGQVMMAPKLEARLLQALDIQVSDRILEIGTGSGYLTALLGSLGAHVTSIEIFEDLSERAKENLRRSVINNIKLHIGDGLEGWSSAAPYDIIVVTGSSRVRRTAIEMQMSIHGRMFIIVGTAPVMEALLITRLNKDIWTSEVLFETELTPLIGAEAKPEFHF
jgi:protein-L-isoaspartate(D-aspartate) O-methyltransferase